LWLNEVQDFDCLKFVCDGQQKNNLSVEYTEMMGIFKGGTNEFVHF